MSSRDCAFSGHSRFFQCFFRRETPFTEMEKKKRACDACYRRKVRWKIPAASRALPSPSLYPAPHQQHEVPRRGTACAIQLSPPQHRKRPCQRALTHHGWRYRSNAILPRQGLGATGASTTTSPAPLTVSEGGKSGQGVCLLYALLYLFLWTARRAPVYGKVTDCD